MERRTLLICSVVAMGVIASGMGVGTILRGGFGTGGGDSINQGDSENVDNEQGTLGIYLPQGHVFEKCKVNDTKTCVATLTPANATIKTLNWESSDETKVSIAKKQTESGGSQTLKLVSYFSGNVTITASSAVDSNVKTSFTVNMTNFVQTGKFIGFGNNSDDPCIYEAGHVGNSCGCVSIAADNSSAAFMMEEGSCYSFGAIFELIPAVDTTFTFPSDPSLSECYASTFEVDKIATKTKANSRFAFFDLTNKPLIDNGYFPSRDATYSFTADDYTGTVKTTAFVRPSSVTGGASITF